MDAGHRVQAARTLVSDLRLVLCLVGLHRMGTWRVIGNYPGQAYPLRVERWCRRSCGLRERARARNLDSVRSP